MRGGCGGGAGVSEGEETDKMNMNLHEEIKTACKSGRTIHVVCAPKKDYLAVITAYIPTLDKWEKDFKCRRK